MPVCVVLSLIKEKENESAWYDGKAKERGLSLFPSSASPSLFFHYCLVFSLGYPGGASAEERDSLLFWCPTNPKKTLTKEKERGNREIEEKEK